jgi:hypothetical protein
MNLKLINKQIDDWLTGVGAIHFSKLNARIEIDRGIIF